LQTWASSAEEVGGGGNCVSDSGLRGGASVGIIGPFITFGTPRNQPSLLARAIKPDSPNFLPVSAMFRGE